MFVYVHVSEAKTKYNISLKFKQDTYRGMYNKI